VQRRQPDGGNGGGLGSEPDWPNPSLDVFFILKKNDFFGVG
jgi:hypothetical protein